jgi:hypothetical protein
MKRVHVLLMAAVLVMTTTGVARAADVEVGASLVSANIGVGEGNDISSVGIPSGGLVFLQPGLFASIFVDPHVAIEPQIGLIWASASGDSFHSLHGGVQVDYFVLGNRRSSPYVFGAVGVIDISDDDTNPASISAGAGYRIPVGDRLTVRFDGRFSHYTNGGGNAVGFAVSLGGVFGR